MLLWLQLKTIADVGFIGKPNAGKSSLLAALSRARPKVADYPFTTLRPHLGVLRVHDRSLVVADIPGLIEGAHEGLGLGDRFLKHGERCRLLIYVIGLDDPDPAETLAMLRHEVETYNPAMAQKASLLVLSKIDYGCIGLADHSKSPLKKLETVQNNILRAITNTQRSTPQLLSILKLGYSLSPREECGWRKNT